MDGKRQLFVSVAFYLRLDLNSVVIADAIFWCVKTVIRTHIVWGDKEEVGPWMSNAHKEIKCVFVVRNPNAEQEKS